MDIIQMFIDFIMKLISIFKRSDDTESEKKSVWYLKIGIISIPAGDACGVLCPYGFAVKFG